MFDRNNQADLTALKNEVLNDPEALNYAAVLKDTKALLKLLNDPESWPGTTVNVAVESLQIPDVVAVIDGADYDALAGGAAQTGITASALDVEWVKAFISMPSSEPLISHKDKFLAVFGAGSTTRSAAIALTARDGSRAEILFGVGTVLTNEDLAAARARG